MKARKIKELKAEIKSVLRGETAPGRVYTLEPDGKGGFARKQIDPEEYRRRQRAQAGESNEATAARARLNLTQKEFSKLLGVSIDTLQNWEQGRRKPRGAAKVLLRVATQDPSIVLTAAAGPALFDY